MTLADVTKQSNVRTPEDDALLMQVLQSADRFPKMTALIKANKVSRLYATSNINDYNAMSAKIREGSNNLGTINPYAPGVVIGGYYRPDKDFLGFNLEVAKNAALTDASPDTAGVSHQVYRDTGDLIQFSTALFLHEQAHNLFFKLVLPDKDAAALNRFQKTVDTIGVPALNAGRLISAYANEHAFEWYAESVLGYLYYPDRLKSIDAPTYEMVSQLFA